MIFDGGKLDYMKRFAILQGFSPFHDEMGPRRAKYEVLS